MLTYTLQSSSKTPLYVQLYESIKVDIIQGVLKKGEKLPSKRAAAKNLGVSLITVESAYGNLQSEGYIYSVPKKGFFVSEISFLPPTAPEKAKNNTPHLPERKKYCYDFTSNGVVAENFPFSVWVKLMRETFHRSQHALMQPSPVGGVPELKEAISAHLKQFRNMRVAPEQIVIGAGTEYLYSLIIQLLGTDKIYAVQNPGYLKPVKIYQNAGVKCVFIHEDHAGISTEELLKNHADIAHISPSHHFPSGTVMSAARRHELLKLAGEADNRYIIEDDYDSEFRLSGRPLPSLQALDNNDKVIYVNTFTKCLSPTIRISYMVLPKKLCEEFYRKLGFYSCTVSNFEQYTLASFISGGYFEKHINRMRNYYRKIRNTLLEEIAASALACISEVSEEEAGLHFLLKVNTEHSDAFLKERAAQRGVHISFLSEYYLKDTQAAPPHILVMNYSALEKEKIPAAVKALADILIN